MSREPAHCPVSSGRCRERQRRTQVTGVKGQRVPLPGCLGLSEQMALRERIGNYTAEEGACVTAERLKIFSSRERQVFHRSGSIARKDPSRAVRRVREAWITARQGAWPNSMAAYSGSRAGDWHYHLGAAPPSKRCLNSQRFLISAQIISNRHSNIVLFGSPNSRIQTAA
jgi:hypothetical protein